MQLPYPYLLFLGDATEAATRKPPSACATGPGSLPGEWSVLRHGHDGPAAPCPKGGARTGGAGARDRCRQHRRVIGENWIPRWWRRWSRARHCQRPAREAERDASRLRPPPPRHGRRLIDIRTPPRATFLARPVASGRQTAPHGRYRLRAGQEIHGARHRARVHAARGESAIFAPPGRPAS